MQLHHVAYAVPAIEKAIPAWEALGARVESSIIEIKQHNAKVCFLALPDARIELVERPNANGRIDHLCFLCRDFPTRVAQAKQQGGVVIKPPVPSEAFGGKLMCFISYAHIGLIEWIDDPENG
jgi:catechol 2,3-dioxygenase-like lactoylglutathione lyase family enzyme